MNESALYPRPRMKRQVQIYNNNTMDRITVHNLPPNATVLIQIRVLTKYFVGPASDPVRVVTPEGGLSLSHTSLTVNSVIPLIVLMSLMSLIALMSLMSLIALIALMSLMSLIALIALMSLIALIALMSLIALIALMFSHKPCWVGFHNDAEVWNKKVSDDTGLIEV